MSKNIQIKRAYENYSKEDGIRILIDRIWPRGIKKEDIKIDEWMKDIAPSNELRKWFGHQPDKWKGFSKRYKIELKDKNELCERIMKYTEKRVTLIYSAKDVEYNNAVVLKDYLKNDYLK